jgi:hypothetical protein
MRSRGFFVARLFRIAAAVLIKIRTMSVPMVATEGFYDGPPARAEVAPQPQPLPLTVIREMLLMLDSLTIAGQRHIMEKVVRFVEEQLPRARSSLSRRNLGAIEAIMKQLRHESDRLVPDVSVFSRGAQSLLALLVALE